MSFASGGIIGNAVREADIGHYQKRTSISLKVDAAARIEEIKIV